MQARRYAAIDAVIEGQIAWLVMTRGNFTKQELVDGVMRHDAIRAELRKARTRGSEFGFDRLLERGLVGRITTLLHKKDSVGVRKFESYNPGYGEPTIWFEMSAVDLPRLDLLITAADKRERAMQLRKKVLILIRDRLQHMKEGATVGDVYDDVKGVIAQFLKTNKSAA